MRRYVIILAGLSIIPTGIACQHTAGKCDCNPITPPCAKYGLYAGECAPATQHAVPAPVIKEEAPKKAVYVPVIPESPVTPESPTTLPGVSGF